MRASASACIDEVCAARGVDPELVRKRGRSTAVQLARHAAIALLAKRRPLMSQVELSVAFGVSDDCVRNALKRPRVRPDAALKTTVQPHWEPPSDHCLSCCCDVCLNGERSAAE